MKLIDKDKVVAEIEKRKSELQSRITELGTFESNTLGLFQDVDLYNDILSFLDTLETKEVNLEKEIYDAEKRFGDIDEMGGYKILIFDFEFRDVLRHFFELGIKSKVK